MLRKLLLLTTLMAALAGPAFGQLTVTGLRNLNFGVVIKGVPLHVAPNDPVKSGEFQFITAIGNRVRVQFTLPTRLIGPGGAQLPISFNATDAIATGTAPTSIPVTFDPRVARTFTIVTSTRILVFLGGTVSPAVAQVSGTYTGTVTLTITIL